MSNQSYVHSKVSFTSSLVSANLNDCRAQLENLDQKYMELEASGSILTQALIRLKDEEKMLCEALSYATESLRDKRSRETKERENYAIQRLEHALLKSSDEEDNNDMNEEHSL